MHRRAIAVACCAAIGLTATAVAAQAQERTSAPAAAFDRLAAAAKRDGSVRVIAGLRVSFTPEGALGASARGAQRSAIARATGEMRRVLRGTNRRVVHTYDAVPYIALELSPGALERLRDSGLAASVVEDRLNRPTLAQTTGIVEAKEAASMQRDGRNTAVAILDTGVDKNHPFLRHTPAVSKVVSEACYSDGDCPGGVSESTAVGSGVPCTYAPDACRHGTHVAGIAAGKGSSFSGVAKEARIISINVFSRFDGSANCGAPPAEDPCALSWDSDILKGLQRVHALRNTFTIGAANISIGGGQFASACDSSPIKAGVDNLRSARIATAIASGNNGFGNAVNSPGCISTAITVGATNDSDQVALFSNSGALVDYFAPGVAVNSSVPVGTGPGGTDFDVFDGTSMATPHVAGAWSIARQVAPTATVTQVEAALDGTGKPVTDTFASPQITRDRIRVFSAAAQLKETGFTTTTNWTGLVGGNIVSDGIGLARRTTANHNPTTGPLSGTFTITGIPAGGRVRAVYLVWQVVGGPDATAVFKGTSRTGTLVGGSGQFTCWNVNNRGAYRTYRAVIPNSAVPGNGTYAISGVGGAAAGIAGRPDGQGASLIVVYDVPTGTGNARAHLRFGSMTGRPNQAAMTHTFTGLSVPAGATMRALHVGIGDGETFSDPAMVFNGGAISAANVWSGTEGRFWDDNRFTLSATRLPAGTSPRTNTQGATGECLTWSYAALTYRGP
jgi:subtilisin family serine protease